MSLTSKLLSASGGVDKLYVDDVFSAYTYVGNGGTQVINNGIDLAGKSGLVWIKSRGEVRNHCLYDTLRGVQKRLSSDLTSVEATGTTELSSFNSNGFSVGSYIQINNNGVSETSWTFARAKKFFDVVTYTGNGVAGRQIPHELGIAPGMIIVKKTSGGSVFHWFVYHRSTGGTMVSLLSDTTEAFALTEAWNNTNPSSSTVTLGTSGGTNESGATYVAYLFAHDDSADSIVQCGSVTVDASGSGSIDLGWEPQFAYTKPSSQTGSHFLTSTAQDMSITSSKWLRAESSAVESASPTESFWTPNATGMNISGHPANSTVIYMAIRRSNKPPKLGTEVYSAIARTGTGAAATVTGVGFAPDLVTVGRRNTNSNQSVFTDRLRGSLSALAAVNSSTEQSNSSAILSFEMDGLKLGTGGAIYPVNATGGDYINHFFKRAVGVFDEVCYTGTGSARTVQHGLGVPPELMIVKQRSAGSTNWPIYSAPTGNTKYIYLNAANAVDTYSMWNNTTPTLSAFNVDDWTEVNQSGATYVAYLFASKAGISKVFSYTGNGSSQTINCGFTTGARFFLVKSTSVAGSWWVYDSVRGISAPADPALQLNSTAAEITTADAVDPHVSGVIVNQEATCSINANGVSYIGLAFA
jgi:hypothetical protein